MRARVRVCVRARAARSPLGSSRDIAFRWASHRLRVQLRTKASWLSGFPHLRDEAWRRGPSRLGLRAPPPPFQDKFGRPFASPSPCIRPFRDGWRSWLGRPVARPPAGCGGRAGAPRPTAARPPARQVRLPRARGR
eukprot:15462655-Alexandrium_andersonii.AAC.1